MSGLSAGGIGMSLEMLWNYDEFSIIQRCPCYLYSDQLSLSSETIKTRAVLGSAIFVILPSSDCLPLLSSPTLQSLIIYTIKALLSRFFSTTDRKICKRLVNETRPYLDWYWAHRLANYVLLGSNLSGRFSTLNVVMRERFI